MDVNAIHHTDILNFLPLKNLCTTVSQQLFLLSLFRSCKAVITPLGRSKDGSGLISHLCTASCPKSSEIAGTVSWSDLILLHSHCSHPPSPFPLKFKRELKVFRRSLSRRSLHPRGAAPLCILVNRGV